MAIIQAKHVTVIGHKQNRSQILKALQGLGAVQIEQNSLEAVEMSETSEAIIHLEKKLADVVFALDFIRPYDTAKKAILQQKPVINEKGLDDLQALERRSLPAFESLHEFAEEISWANASIMRSHNLIAQVEPYRNFDEKCGVLGKSIHTYAAAGIIPSEQKTAFETLMASMADEACYEILDEINENTVIFAVVHLDSASEFRDEMKLIGFNEMKYGQFEASPREIIEKEKRNIEANEQKKREIENELRQFIPYIKDYKSLEDYYNAALQRENAALRFGYTKSAFVLEGWINENAEGEVEKAIETAAPEAYTSFRYPYAEETYPTIIENNFITRPFEAVTQMYDTPSAKGMDPSSVMAPFFFVVFGMMVSDAGYGVVLAVVCTLVLLYIRPKGMFGKILGVITLGGVSTLGWGLIFGGWFGVSVKPLWFNPLEEPLMMLGLCFGIGMIQLIVGLATGAAMNIRRKKPWSALFDQGSWILLLIGLPAMILGGTIAVVGKYMAFTGAGLVLVFGGRNKKGIVGKMIGGFSSLYGITGYLSDILSYSRIFGMGLATGVIAMVFNTIAGMMWGKLYGVGFVLAVVILAVGHVFNIGINTLGAYVHSCRLQYIEFYNKFFEGGGIPFKPLKADIKHYRFEK